MAERLQETCSGGGPVLAIPAELAASWGGYDEDAASPNDYERACDEMQDLIGTEYGGVGWVPVGEGRALVLDTEMMTAVLPRDDGALIIRNYEEPELTAAMVEGHLAALDPASWQELAGGLTLTDGRLFLFDSAYPGAADPTLIEADDGVAIASLAPGPYVVRVACDGYRDYISLSRRG